MFITESWQSHKKNIMQFLQYKILRFSSSISSNIYHHLYQLHIPYNNVHLFLVSIYLWQQLIRNGPTSHLRRLKYTCKKLSKNLGGPPFWKHHVSLRIDSYFCHCSPAGLKAITNPGYHQKLIKQSLSCAQLTCLSWVPLPMRWNS